MKRFFLFAIAVTLAFTGTAYAQAGKFGATPEDSVECIKYLSFYKEYYKGGNIREAVPSWRNALKACPEGVRQSLYQDGQGILKYLFAREKNADRKKELIDSLMLMYDIRVKYYPKNAVGALAFKTRDAAKFLQGQDQRIYDIAMSAIKRGEDALDSDVYSIALQAAINLFQAEKLSSDEVMNLYTQINEFMEAKLGKPKGKDQNYDTAKANIESLFANSGLANCDNLLALFGPQFESRSRDVAFVKRMVMLLSKAGCETSDMYLKSVMALHSLQPSATTAYYLYRLYSSRDDNAKAMECLQEAIDSEETGAETKAEYMVEMGTYYFKKMNNCARGAELARKAIQASETISGKANLLLGHIWAMAKSFGTEIDEKAHFWVAVDYFQRAKAADESLAVECNEAISNYSRYFPSTEDIFMHDLNVGQSYTVNASGMSATTTIRAHK